MNQKRFVPITVAGVICFFTAFLLGAGLWFFFGSNPLRAEESATVIQNDEPSLKSTNVNNPISEKPSGDVKKKLTKAPAGEVKIAGGEVVLGGVETKLPLKRVVLEDFLIAETEVTNEQYAEFVEATKNKAPEEWVNSKFPKGKEKEPVVGMTWADANAYCAWLSGELDAEVRLPTEAEWERAARGNTDYKYPWGNEWSDKAAPFAGKEGKILPVKSLFDGKSPFGVYEMVGNVWEWTSDLAVNSAGQAVLYEKAKQRIVKGGSAKQPDVKLMTIDTHLFRPENRPSSALGFRYVIIRKK